MVTTSERIVSALPPETLAWFGEDELRAHVFIDKYALRGSDGQLLELTPPEMWKRLARELASVESPDRQSKWEENFLWLLTDFRFVPGGRIMHGAGKVAGRVTLLNCYVIPHRHPDRGADSIEAIYKLKAEMARTYSSGGGVGIDISALRPRRSIVHNASSTSSGAVSYMEEFSLTTGTIGQDGRRGALMITIADWHPDVLEFATIKTKPNHRTAQTLRNFQELFPSELHPTLERVLVAGQVRFANVSIRLSDAFMKAVEQDGDWPLEFPDYEATGMDAYHQNWTGDLVEWKRAGLPTRQYDTIRARTLWEQLIKGARDYAEPGCLFWDTTKFFSTSEYNGMGVTTTNPCAEIPLEPYGCCCLGNVNLAAFVVDTFRDSAKVDWEQLEQVLRYATRFLDNVLTYNADKHPLPEQRMVSLYSRRIGVGFTGLGDMLVKLGLKYDTDKAVEFVDDLFNRIKNIVYDESANLAVEKGTFPGYDHHQHFFGDGKRHRPFLDRLDGTILLKATTNGLRNVALLTVPPVGSGASLAGVTSGVEPIFDLSYTRRSESLSKDEFQVFHPLVKEYMTRFGIEREEDLPPYFVTAHNIKPEMRVKMQAAIQKHIDHSISSTINLPRETLPEEVEKIYFQAWKQGLKGITVYREGSREGILITDDAAKKAELAKAAMTGAMVGAGVVAKAVATKLRPMVDEVIELSQRQVTHPSPRPRPKVTTGRMERIETPRGRTYVSVNWDDHGVCEVFVLSKDKEAEAIGRLASLALRSGVDVREIIDQLWRVSSNELAIDRSSDGTSVHLTTISQAVALGLGRVLYGEGFRPDKELPKASSLPEPLSPQQEKLPLGGAVRSDGAGDFVGICPDCGAQLIHENGCARCRQCGYSRC